MEIDAAIENNRSQQFFLAFPAPTVYNGRNLSNIFGVYPQTMEFVAKYFAASSVLFLYLIYRGGEEG
jgi:hypothetical protein